MTALISIKQAAQRTTLSRSRINQLRERGDFPKAVPIGDKRIAFVEAEVEAWIRSRIACRQQEAA